MEKLFEDIKNIEFETTKNFDYDLDKESYLISSYLPSNRKKLLQNDFDQFFKTGKYIIFNTFCGGILFLKVPEQIEKIIIKLDSKKSKIFASVIYKSTNRKLENIKHKPAAGKIEMMQWDIELIFPNILKYTKLIQYSLLIVIGKIIKKICEYGRDHFPHMKIENEFEIEISIDGQLTPVLEVKLA